MLKHVFIEPSRSSYGAPVFFVKKTDGSLRLVCDWRQLNRITVKNKVCLPSIEDLFDTVQGGRYFTKLDLQAGYHQIRIQDEDVPRTAINTPFGHFQFSSGIWPDQYPSYFADPYELYPPPVPK